ncbi:aspartic proteinase CDR1-like [Papaver somniferum]|uniref:aspartic proteinase CDR1-like n=1 Tax=Papaver somniferum TaxID=3469 RepID=UPI000E6F807B|nr:aspartic proteinase CDR1-like [Papaver somniferum]
MGRTKPCLFIFLLTIVILQNSTIAMNPKGFTLRMIHKDSEESPFFNPLDHSITQDERFQTLIDQSRARARHIASQINPDVYASVVYEDTYYYAASMGIGTFPGVPGIMKYYLLIDSASDITWLQCEGATQIFNQDSPLYPWRSSTSYHPIPCRDPSPGCQSCNEEGQCDYTLTYAGSQVTYGVFAQEKFTLPSRTRGVESFQLIMGCSLRQANFTFGIGGRNGIAGILGLGRGEFSVADQLGNGKFSYCFEKYRGRMIGNTFLSFGADATIEGQVIRTPIVRTSFETPYYYLNLEGISVGGARVQIPRRELQINNDQTGGCVIDSGAPLTTMYRNIFDRVAASVDLYFERFGCRFCCFRHSECLVCEGRKYLFSYH